MSKSNPPQAVLRPHRYSALPIEAYDKTYGGRVYGPSTSALLKSSIEAWNLAYLCFDFENGDFLKEVSPDFTTAVHHTVNYVLDLGAVDVLGNAPADIKVKGLLRLSAVDFVSKLSKHRRLQQLPIYKLLGTGVVLTMLVRAQQCVPDPVAHLFKIMDTNPTDFTEARALLSRF